jgi:predicted dehydrogenase
MRLLILGTGHMASAHARNFIDIEGVAFAGAVDVDKGRAEAFRDKYSFERAFTSLEDAIAWGEFDAVANVTPDSAHHSTTMQCLAAGKHVFCEKPLATNYHDAVEMAETAENANLVGMVNLTYRNVAQLQTARRLVTSGQIGKIRHVEASYLQSWLVSKIWGTGAPIRNGCGACRAATAPMACWAMSASTSSISPAMAPRSTSTTCSAG